MLENHPGVLSYKGHGRRLTRRTALERERPRKKEKEKPRCIHIYMHTHTHIYIYVFRFDFSRPFSTGPVRLTLVFTFETCRARNEVTLRRDERLWRRRRRRRRRSQCPHRLSLLTGATPPANFVMRSNSARQGRFLFSNRLSPGWQ